jgi:hypothetical protein
MDREKWQGLAQSMTQGQVEKYQQDNATQRHQHVYYMTQNCQ